MRTHSFVVNLLAGWHEVPNQSPRVYKRAEKGAGMLQISLKPPSVPEITSNRAAEEELERIMQTISSDELGTRLALTSEPAKAGIAATAVYNSDKRGIFRVWLITGKVNVFATYTMGSLETVQTEMQEAAQIVRDITLV